MSSEEKLLHKIQGLFYFTTSLAGIFLSLYLFKLGGFQAVIKFGIISLSMLFVLCIASGWFLKKYPSKYLMIAGLIIFTVFYGLLFLLREKSLTYLIPLAIISGTGYGFFWPGNNLTTYIVTKEHSRNEFFGKLAFFMNVGMGMGTIIAGTIIQLSGIFLTKDIGYATVFLLVAIFMFILSLITLRLPKHSGIDFSLSHIIFHKRQKNWKIILMQQFLYGCMDVAFAAFSAVLIFLILKQEFYLGAQNTISTIIFAIASLIAGKMLQKNPKRYLLGILSPLGLLIFALQQNWIGILSLIFINNVFMPFLGITTAKSVYDVIDKSQESWQNKYHFLIERDSALGLGRIINYLILLFFINPTNQMTVAKTWIFIVPIIPLLILILQWWQYKKSEV
ncbi:MAG: MFS transporter [Candidatus Levybacteria bacterium]|nr:MFS transporter [Candidatus Levybacteria bacterium]